MTSTTTTSPNPTSLRQLHSSNKDGGNNNDPSNNNKTKKRKLYKNSDPDGTHDVAWDTVIPTKDDTTVQEWTIKNPSKISDVQKYIFSTNQIDAVVDHYSSLRKNDEKTNNQLQNVVNNNKVITDPTQRALIKRQQNRNKLLDTKLNRHETKRYKSAIAAVDTEHIFQSSSNYGMIEVETDMEKTYKLNQLQLKNELQQQNNPNASNIYNIQLQSSNGPYGTKFDRSGRYIGLYSNNGGHVAIMDSIEKSIINEFHLPNERIRDVCFLQNHTLYAVAQRQAVYIYDTTGREIHHCKNHIDPQALQFLPYHYLLTSISRSGYLTYQDTSTGQVVATHRTKLGSSSVLEQNKSNAIIHVGHTNGTVTLWSPNQSTYLVKMLCHKGSSITAMAIDSTGHTMVTAGMDQQLTIWDLRMYQQRHSYYIQSKKPASSLDISQRNLLAVGHGSHVSIWSSDALQTKVKGSYMEHMVTTLGGTGPVHNVTFRPYEDCCLIGHANGISSIVVPGSGEAIYDTYEYNTNPYQDTKQRQESEVRSLLDKLNPNMISLQTIAVGSIEPSDTLTKLQKLQAAANIAAKKKKHGTNTSTEKIASVANDGTGDNDEDDDDEIDAATGKIKKKKKIGKRRGRSKTQSQLRYQDHQKNVQQKEQTQTSIAYETFLNEVVTTTTKSTTTPGTVPSSSLLSTKTNNKKKRRSKNKKNKNTMNIITHESNNNNAKDTNENRNNTTNAAASTTVSKSSTSTTPKSNNTTTTETPSALQRFFT